MAAGSAGVFLSGAQMLLLVAAALLLLFLRRCRWMLAAGGLVLFCHGNHAVGLLLAPPTDPVQIATRAGERLTVEGVVARRPQVDAGGGGGRLLLEVTAAGGTEPLEAARGRLMVRAGEGGFDVGTGDLVRLEGKVRRPRPLGLPGEFDYRRHLAFNGVHATLYLPEAEKVALISPAVDHRVMRLMDQVSDWGGRTVRQAVAGADGAILVALLNGDRSGIPPALEEVYTRAGVNHILSISGFHIGVVALVICQLLYLLLGRSERVLLRCNLRRLVPLLALPPVILYLLVSGSNLATVRSVLMAAVCALTLLLDRETDPVNSLALAALAILTAAPEAIYDISFQLSFLALWGILLSLPLVQGPVARLPWRPVRWTAALVIASAAATLATMVPVALTFHRVSFAGIVSNLVAVPLVGYGGVALGFAGLLLSIPSPALGGWVLQGAGFFIGLCDRFMELCARIPVVHWVARWQDLLACLTVLLIFTLLKGRGRLVALSLTVTVWGAMLVYPLSHPEEGLVMHFLSVGQGESTLIVTPTGQTMLVDCGGVPGKGGERFGKRVLVPALESLGVERIDRLVLTHAHPDHMGGAGAVLERFAVGEFWSADAGEGVDAVTPLLAGKGVALRRFSASSPAESLGPCRIEFLAPHHPLLKEMNEDSLVFRLSWGGWRALFTGDVGGVTEGRLLARAAPVESHLLKVGHHGSRHSSTPAFLKAVGPQHAVISAGFQNVFGLPSLETVNRLEKQGIRIHRTDLDGTVTVFFKHDTVDVMKYN
jgi:competence protein ComEC